MSEPSPLDVLREHLAFVGFDGYDHVQAALAQVEAPVETLQLVLRWLEAEGLGDSTIAVRARAALVPFATHNNPKHPFISDEPLNDAQMRRAVDRSKREGWKDITP